MESTVSQYLDDPERFGYKATACVNTFAVRLRDHGHRIGPLDELASGCVHALLDPEPNSGQTDAFNRSFQRLPLAERIRVARRVLDGATDSTTAPPN
jgi:hypothetical protein